MSLRVRLLASISGTMLIFSFVDAQETTTITVAERQTLSADKLYRRDSPARETTHQLRLTLVHFTGGNWPRYAVLRAATNAAKILEQCDVGLRQVELVRVDAPQQYHYFHTPTSRELARTLQLAKPAVYFVTDTRQQPGFDAEAIGRGNSSTRPELVDSVWLTRGTPDVATALAHEIAHILMDSGEHVDLPENLMRDETAPENTGLTAAQCDQLQKVGTKNGLLRRD